MKSSVLILLTLITISACSIFHKPNYNWVADSVAVDTAMAVAEATWTGENEILPTDYRSARYSDWDLQHTNLYVSFDFDKKQLHGEAEISMKLHFYETDSIVLDAKRMDIQSIELKQGNLWKMAEFTYPDSIRLIVRPGIVFNADNPTVVLKIKYTAKPYSGEVESGSAISQDRGLYFINPDGLDPVKPRQIWTQGETESSSRWFPTIDAPNQKMTQKIAITIPDSMVSLSNGLLISSKKTGNGMREDVWEQKLPHAPYLAMMAIGNWAVVNDKWRNKTVDYYVEKPFASDARRIFGKTPEMMEFFSTYTGVDYPWEKYSQVVVRDFVSGAMENTSATVHMENLQTTEAEYRDETYEDYVSHELFHHWFGDLVTAESWSNITLNESFATYGEYLWREHKYGKENADELLEEFRLYTRLNGMMGGSDNKLVRYQYHRPDDVFDIVSYQKGALILHMLRHEIGDAAFRAGINKYLTDHRFKAAEVDHLRLAMEAVTGRDLHPFFNQWYFTGNQPEINASSSWDSTSKTIRFDIDQIQNHRNTYVLKTKILFTINGKTHIHPINIINRSQSFQFPFSEKPDFWLVDPDNQLLCKINYPNDRDAPYPLETLQKALQTLNNPALQLAVFDRAIALFPDNDSELNETADSIVIAALQSNWSPLLKKVLDFCSYRKIHDSDALKKHLARITLGKFDSEVREKALWAIQLQFPVLSATILPQLTSDPSPKVATSAINYIKWEQHFEDTAQRAALYGSKTIATEWLKKWLREDTGMRAIRCMMTIHKNPKAGLKGFSDVFSVWFHQILKENDRSSLAFVQTELDKPENKLLRRMAAAIISPTLQTYSSEDKPLWFPIAEKLVNDKP